MAYTNSLVITPTVSFTYHSNYNRIQTMVDGIGTNICDYYAVSNTVLGAGQLKSIAGATTSFTYDGTNRVKTVHRSSKINWSVWGRGAGPSSRRGGGAHF